MRKIISIFLILISVVVQAQKPELKGGLESFIKNNIVYPTYSLHNCIQGVINVSFKLSSNGQVSSAKVANGLGVDLDDEALRIVRMSSGKWIVPATYDTTSVVVVPVNFILKGYDCDRLSKGDIALAINAYKNQEALIAVVSNFYKNKERGDYKKEDEAAVLQIKKQLNIDDEYLDEVMTRGSKKLKQGDQLGACEDFKFVKYMGSGRADELLLKNCN